MIIVELLGGLGNQLFQYAAARRLALARGDVLALDIAALDRSGNRAYRLDRFNIHERLATPAEVARLRGHPRAGLLGRLPRLRWKLRPHYRRPVVRERIQFQFEPHWLELPSDVYLIGYWQNEKYFADIADTLRQEFTLRERLSEPSAALARQIDAAESVGVHVRRGDYAAQPTTTNLHGLCSVDYYRTCADQIRQAHPRAIFYVFSDDPAWARDNLALQPAIVVDHNGPQRDYEDLYLLSRCKHFILANSSFSWWAAWLAAWPQKTVYAPKQWMASDHYDTSGLVPVEWHRI